MADLKDKLARLNAIQTDAATQAKLDRINAVEMGGRGHDRETVGKNAQDGESAWTYIKKGGARALDALTVPQAALFTGVAKATGRDVDWGAALGNFSRNEEGESGMERALDSLGVTNKWAQLGVSFVADPLWFTGVGVVRKAGAAKDAIKLATEGGEVVADARKAAMIRAFSPRAQRSVKGTPTVKGDAQQSALIRAFTGMSAEGGRDMTVAQRAAAMRAFSPRAASLGDQDVRAAALKRVADEIADKRDLGVGKSFSVQIEQALGRASRRKGVQYGHKAAVPFKPTRETANRWAVLAKRDAQGKIKTDAWGKPLGAEKVFATRDEAMRYLAQAAKDAKMARGKAPSAKELREGLGQVGAVASGLSDAQKAKLVKAFTSKSKGVKLPKQVAEKLPKAIKSAKPVDKAKLAKALAAGKRPPEGPVGPYAIDEHLRPLNLRGALGETRAKYTEHLTREKGSKAGIRLGAGKFSKTFSTGIPLPARGLTPRRMKGGYLAMKPIEKIAHRLRDIGRESSEAVSTQMLSLAGKYGMTEVDAAGRVGIKQDEAAMIGVFRSANSLNTGLGDRVRKYYESRGLWEPRHSGLIDDLDKRYKALEADLPSGQADRFQERITALKDDNIKLHAEADRFFAKLEKFDRKRDGKKLSNVLDQIAANERKIEMLKQRGPYTPQGKSFKLQEKQMQQHRKDVGLGLSRPGQEFSAKGPAHLETREIADNPFATRRIDDFVDDMVDSGMDMEEARSLAHMIDAELERIGEPGFGKLVQNDFVPEWNAMLLAGRREQTHIWKQVESEIEELLNESGILQDSDLWKAVQASVRVDGMARLGNTQVGRVMMQSIAHLKGWFTFVNPAHFTTNFTGDFTNRNVNGGFRHLIPFDAAPKNKFWQLGSADTYQGKVDWNTLNRKYDVGAGREMTGGELLMMSRMVGLGRGYVGTDVAILVDAFEHAGRGPREWYRWAQRMNIKRENAQRLGTWVRHMQNGDDPITAQIKTLRVHFDYTQLTDFEKLVVRNVLLFYTWFKRNTILQGGAVFTRPGLYSGYADLENAREEIPNEPGYFGEQAAIPTPFGNFAVGAPWGDLRNYELSFTNFRKTILGSVTPIARVPTELAINQQMFTGGRLQDYEGEITPHITASILSGLGVPLDVTSAKEGGERKPGIDPRVAHFLSQFMGPQASTASSLTRPDYEGGALTEALGRFLGVRPQVDRPAAFKRAADYIERKKKADETRRRNAQRER